MFGQLADLGNEADGADGEVAVAETDFVVEDVESGDDVFNVEEGFAHSHEDDMADAAFGEGLEEEVLGDDFAGGEVAVESTHASRAEGASHWTPDLGGNAAAHPFGIREEDTLVDLVVAVMDEEFVDAIGAGAMGCDGEGRDDVVFGEFVAEGFGEIFQVVEFAGGFFVNPLGDLASAKGFFPELNGDLFKFRGGFANERFAVSHTGSLPGWGGFDLG